MEIRDTDSNWVLKTVKYNDTYDSIQVHLDKKPICLELIISDKLISFEARGEDSSVFHRSSFYIDSAENNNEGIQASND